MSVDDLIAASKAKEVAAPPPVVVAEAEKATAYNDTVPRDRAIRLTAFLAEMKKEHGYDATSVAFTKWFRATYDRRWTGR